ncbi:MAG: hypothetical protein ABI640_16910 [Gammaproteobacteria bacterium]
MSATLPPHESVPALRRTQVRVLDDIWLLTLFTLALATGVPWFVSGSNAAFGPVLGGILGIGLIHVALAFLAGSGTRPGAWLVPILTALHAAGVIAMGVVWHYGGGLQNPVLLTAFVLPLIGACFISRWQPYFTAGLAIVVVTLAALIEAPELRWYANGIGKWAADLLASGTLSTPAPFPGFYAPSGYYVALLESFAVLTFVSAAVADYLGTLSERQRAHTEIARERAQSGRELWTNLIEYLPVPALLVEVDTLKVLHLSKSVVPLLIPFEGSNWIGRNVFQTIRFSFPEAVRSLIRGDSGPARPCVIRVEDALHIANVSVRHLGYEGHALALLTIEDVTDAVCTRAALDRMEDAVLVIDSNGRVITFNKSTRLLFPTTEVGIEVAPLLNLPAESAVPWWHPGLRGRRKRIVEIDGQIYQMTSANVPLAGEEEGFCVLAFLPVVGAGSANEAARNTNLQNSTVRPR